MFKDEKYLGAYSLEKDGKYVPVVTSIEKIYGGEFESAAGKEERVFAKLKGFDKPMVLNRSNFKRLEQRFDSFNYADYIGKPVTLMVEKVHSPEGKVDALRFSKREPVAPVKSKSKMTSAQLTAAIKSVQEGKFTPDKIKELYDLTKEQSEQIDNAVVQGKSE